MIGNIGYACMSIISNTKYKSFKLNSFSEQRLYDTVIHNIKETERTIKSCLSNNIHFFRVSSDIIPFASHQILKGIKYMNWIRNDLKEIGKLANKNNMRISMHPGQTCVINSPDYLVVTNSIKDLIYHYNILTAMKLNNQNNNNFDIIIHTGGKYDNKKEAMKRFINIFNNKVPEKIRKHICLENDDKSFTIHDVLKIHEYTGVKVVFDFHHHICNYTNIDYNLDQIFNTWNNNLILKVHISSPKNQEKFRSHADYIDFNYIKDFLNRIDKYDRKIDIMVEAKLKDLAVIQLKNYLGIL